MDADEKRLWFVLNARSTRHSSSIEGKVQHAGIIILPWESQDRNFGLNCNIWRLAGNVGAHCMRLGPLSAYVHKAVHIESP